MTIPWVSKNSDQLQIAMCWSFKQDSVLVNISFDKHQIISWADDRINATFFEALS